jgi:hypothetical protein
MWLWRAVDDEGEVLGMLVQKRRNKDAAIKLILDGRLPRAPLLASLMAQALPMDWVEQRALFETRSGAGGGRDPAAAWSPQRLLSRGWITGCVRCIQTSFPHLPSP